MFYTDVLSFVKNVWPWLFPKLRYKKKNIYPKRKDNGFDKWDSNHVISVKRE